jgi:hypothetical protein
MATDSALTPVGTQAIWAAWVVFALLLMPLLGQWEWLCLAWVMGSALPLSRDTADATPGGAVSPRLPPAGARSGGRRCSRLRRGAVRQGRGVDAVRPIHGRIELLVRAAGR